MFFKVPLASKARMNDALDGLKTFGNPCKLTQLTQRVFCTGVEVVVMDVADQRLHVVVFWRKNKREYDFVG